MHNDVDLESAVERIQADPLLKSRDLHSLDLEPGIDHGLSFPRKPGSRTIAGRYPGDASIAQQPSFLEVSTAPRRNVQRNFRCRWPVTSSSSSSSASSSSFPSYSSEYQLPLQENRVLVKSNNLGINQFQVPPVERHLRRHQVEPCSSSSAPAVSSGQEIGNGKNEKSAARHIVLTRLLSHWPLPIPNRDTPRSDDDLLLAKWRHQIMASSRSSVKDGIEHTQKRNCETNYKKDCLLRRVVPRKTVDPMLMMVGIGKK